MPQEAVLLLQGHRQGVHGGLHRGGQPGAVHLMSVAAVAIGCANRLRQQCGAWLEMWTGVCSGAMHLMVSTNSGRRERRRRLRISGVRPGARLGWLAAKGLAAHSHPVAELPVETV